MKRLIMTIVLLLGVLSVTGEAQNGTHEFDLNDITRGAFYPRSAGHAYRPSSDGKSYTMIADRGAAIVRYAYETGAAVDTLFNCRTARDCSFDGIDDYLISKDGFHIVLLRDSRHIYRRSISYEAYAYDVRRNMVSRLNETAGRVRIPTLSPDGRMCAYVINNDIYIKKFDFNTEVRVTTDGRINSILNGITDWVYEEELETVRLMDWSADSGQLAYVRTDESAVKTYEMTVYGQELYPFNYTYKYPKAGEQNSTVSVHLYDVVNRDTHEVSLPMSGEFYIPRLTFDDGTLYVFTLNRRQNDLKIFGVNPRSLVTKLWMQDQSDTYIDNGWIRQLTFTRDGALYVNENDGYAHLYKYNRQGTRGGLITDSKSDVTAFYGENPQGEVFVAMAEPTPMDRTIVAIDRRGRKRLLSPEKGYSTAVFSSDMSYYLLSYSTLNEVPVYEIRRTKDAKVVKVLEDNNHLKKALSDYAFAPKEWLSLKTDTGQELNAWILKPPHFDPSHRYPVVMTQYSGPNSQEALNRFGIDWAYAMAQKGYIVACVDGRGTGGRGTAFRKCTYLKMGVLESDDQIAAAHALGQLPYVDGHRIGIFGWSFGGYNVLMCMTRGKGTFKCGVAVAPPSDWRFYDTIYTERYMRTPQENPKGYRDTSVLNYVNGLQGKLLIVHGTADDNVHVQNTMFLTRALIDADKPYDMMIYTDKNHSIYGGNTRHHLFTKVIDYFTTNL